jgi:hypothetical protein
MLCLPSWVTVNWVHSEWLSWHRTRLAILVIIPASFAVLTTLYTRIGLLRGHAGMLFNFTQSRPMKHPVALQSTRAWAHYLTTVSITSISMSTLRDIDLGLEETTYLLGNWCSQAGRQLHQLELGNGRWGLWLLYSQYCISQVVLRHLPEDMQNNCNSTTGAY